MGPSSLDLPHAIEMAPPTQDNVIVLAFVIARTAPPLLEGNE